MMQKAVLDLSPEGGMAESSTKKKILRWDPKKRKFIKVPSHYFYFIRKILVLLNALLLLMTIANTGGNDINQEIAIRG